MAGDLRFRKTIHYGGRIVFPVRALSIFFLFGAACMFALSDHAQAQDTPSKTSPDQTPSKSGTHRKKKTLPADDDSAPATPRPKSTPAPDADATPPKKKRTATDGDSNANANPPAPAADQPHHAPAATIEAEQLAEFSSQPAAVQQIIKAALDLTKLNLTYTFGSAEPSNGGMDCSGTIYYLLRAQGLKDVPRDSSEQYVWARKHGQFFAVVSTEADSFEFKDLVPGDLMFWTGTYQTGRAVPISHVMMYLGKEKGSGKRVMFGASDGRSYNGVQRWGVSVFDFKMPKVNPADTEKHVDFVGYAHIPTLRESSSPVQVAVNAHPANDKAVPPPATPKPARTTPTPVPATSTPVPTTLAPAIAPVTPAPAPAAVVSAGSPSTPPPSAPAPGIASNNFFSPPSPLHEPERGTPERKAIMDALREDKFPGQAKSVIFQVNYLRVHSGWAWADVTPQDKNGKPVESRTKVLMHYDEGNWKAVDLGKLPFDMAKPVSADFIKGLSEAIPGVPADIFPKRRE